MLEIENHEVLIIAIVMPVAGLILWFLGIHYAYVIGGEIVAAFILASIYWCRARLDTYIKYNRWFF